MALSCGIDFGTSNTVFTLLNSGGTVVDSFTVPTIFFIYAESQGISKVEIGKDAVSTFMSRSDGRIIHSIKKSFPNPYYKSTRVNNCLLSVEDLLAVFVEKFHSCLIDRYTFIPENIVLGRPVSFSDDPDNHSLALDRLEKGFKLGGFSDFELLEEPIGAYLSLRDQLGDDAENILICDFGAGTSDFTLLKKETGDGISILGKEGIALGGNEYDGIILTKLLASKFGKGASFQSFDRWLPFPEHYLNSLSKWSNVFYMNRTAAEAEIKDLIPSVDKKASVRRLLALLDKKKNYEALLQAQNCKHELQDSDEARFIFRFLGINKYAGLNGTDYGECSAEIDAKILDTAEKLVEKFLGTGERIDKLVFTGGSSKLRNLQATFKKGFPEAEILFDKNFYNSISHGLAIHAHEQSLIR